MASSAYAHRVAAIGISGGLGVALPFAAYAATLPFRGLDGMRDLVGGDIVPFAAGTLAGVGILAISAGLMDRRAARRDADEADEGARFSAAFAGADAVAPRTSAHRSEPKGVPVIARAVDAMDEEAAWAEIDAMLSEDSPVSCDPLRSKDMYEIALDELRRAEQGRRERAAATPCPTAASSGASLAGLPDIGSPVAQVTAAGATAATGPFAQVPAAAVRPAAVPVPRGVEQGTSSPFARETVPSPSASAVQPASASSSAPVEVAVTDYSGHEAMWAEALAVLAEDAPAPVSAPATPVSPDATAAFMAAAGAADATSHLSPERMAAVAEGAARTGVHNRVNEILEEEFERVPSYAVRNTGREYLRVIQGGTSAMPRLQVEA